MHVPPGMSLQLISMDLSHAVLGIIIPSHSSSEASEVQTSGTWFIHSAFFCLGSKNSLKFKSHY